jgi:hypothetical protein
MIRLTATTQKLQSVLAGPVATNSLHYVVCWSDKTTTTYTGGVSNGVLSGTTAADICTAPAASTIRDIDSISINNLDTAAVILTVNYYDSATLRTIIKVTLAVGDQLLYTHGSGWMCIDNTGALKPAQSVAIATHGATSKTTPVDADELPLLDSASSYVLNRLTWANLKTTFINTLLALDQTWTGSQRGTITTDNDLSFDLNASNNFFCTPTAGGALTFTNHTSGQSGFVLFVNGSNYAITAAATTKCDNTFLTTISTTGTYLISYLDNGTNAYCTCTKALA